jgi:hypothetical protein
VIALRHSFHQKSHIFVHAKAPIISFTWLFGRRIVVENVHNVNDATAALAPIKLNGFTWCLSCLLPRALKVF